MYAKMKNYRIRGVSVKLSSIFTVIALGLCVLAFMPSTSVYAEKNDNGGGGVSPGPCTAQGCSGEVNPPSNEGSCSSGDCDPAISCTNNNCDLISTYVNPAIDVLSICFGLIAIISIIIGGINYTTSEGDPQKSSRAKSRIVNTILAILIYLFLFAFLQFLIPGGAFNRS